MFLQLGDVGIVILCNGTQVCAPNSQCNAVSGTGLLQSFSELVYVGCEA